ncbi:MAG: acyl-CoA thioesterase [Bacteroidia bacterium]
MSNEETNPQTSATVHFPVKLEIRLDWSELDEFGVINNVMFFKYFQSSRLNYWALAGFERDYKPRELGPFLVSSNCQLKKPLFYPGHIVVEARVDFIKNTSLGFSHRLLNEAGEICAEAQDIIVLYDFIKKTTVPVPRHVRQNIEEIEKRKF